MKRLCLAVAGLVVSTAPAFALEVEERATSQMTPAEMWSTIGDFCGIADWHPAVEACEESEVDGATRRTLTLANTAEPLVEELVSRDDEAMRYTYRILEGPLPVQNYESTLGVTSAEGGSEIVWSGTFDAADGLPDDEAVSAITGVYASGLDQLSGTVLQ